MTCRGIRPNGNQCDAPEQYVSSETGLCGSCGAPESTALVPVGSTDMMADPEVDALYEALPLKAQRGNSTPHCWGTQPCPVAVCKAPWGLIEHPTQPITEHPPA